jgi:hypothetical protein
VQPPRGRQVVDLRVAAQMRTCGHHTDPSTARSAQLQSRFSSTGEVNGSVQVARCFCVSFL